MTLVPYLTFNGNCREAMTFYHSCLGGELNFQTVGDSPLAESMPEKMKSCILNASLIKNEFKLMASDMTSEMGLTQGNSISLLLKCNTIPEIKNYFVKLSEGGTTNQLIEINHWGSYSGELTDKFGTHWMLYHHPNDN